MLRDPIFIALSRNFELCSDDHGGNGELVLGVIEPTREQAQCPELVRRVRAVVAARAVQRRSVAVREKTNRAHKLTRGYAGSKLAHFADWLVRGDCVMRAHLRDKIHSVIH